MLASLDGTARLWVRDGTVSHLLVEAAGIDVAQALGVYIKGEFGVRLEDDMHVTDDGAELFTPQSPSIEQPF